MYIDTDTASRSDGRPVLPTNQENKAPRRKDSFFLHMRPSYFDPLSTGFSATWYLGFLSVFLLVLECVTGLVLMVYYAPTPEAAYESIVRLNSEIPFGWLFRDLHRLGGELMIVAVLLHMVRVFLHGKYSREYGFTWITGIFLLLCTLVLTFSGYLLPWDQLAYWAVTIGCGLAASIPVVGDDISYLLKGGFQFGHDGLLRFYLVHIMLVPFLMLLFFGVHYFRVSKIHLRRNRRKPVGNLSTEENIRRKLSLFPDVFSREVLLILLATTVLLFAVTYFYDAPLIQHADPRHTPAGTRAPWFFLWLQGGLKFGDSFIMGIVFPLILLGILLLIPFISRAQKTGETGGGFLIRFSIVVLVSCGLCFLSYAGLPKYGIDVNPAAAFVEKLAPEEGDNAFQAIPFGELQVGFYSTGPEGSEWPASLHSIRDFYVNEISSLENSTTIANCDGFLIVEDWQKNLKRITIRLSYQDSSGAGTLHSIEKIIFIHNDSN